MALTFASGRETLSSDSWTVNSTTGGNVPTGTYYLSLQARNRIGFNLPLYTSITVANNSKIVITINPEARLLSEDWHYYVVGCSTTNTPSSYIQIAKIPGINPDDQFTLLTLPIVTEISYLYINPVSALPTTNLVNGTTIAYTTKNLVYEYDSYDTSTLIDNELVLLGANNKRWKVKGNLSNYITNTTGLLGCNQDLREITDTTGIIIPKYNPNTPVATLSPPIRYVLTPSVQTTISKGTRIGITIRLSGLDKSSLFSDKLVFVPEGFVDLGTGELQTTLNDLTTPMSTIGTNINYQYGKNNLYIEEDLPTTQGFQFKLQLRFTAAQYASLIPEGASISFNMDFTDSAGVYQELGQAIGNIVFSDGELGRVYPGVGLNVYVGSRSGLIKNFSFPLVNGNTITNLSPNTDNQQIVINQSGNSFVGFPNIPSDSSLRALVGTVSGVTNPSTESEVTTLTANQGLIITVNHPVLNDKGIVRSNYPDVIANSDKGSFNPNEIVFYVRNTSTNVIKEFTGNSVVVDNTQDFTLLDWTNATTIAEIPTQTDLAFSLYEPNDTFTITKTVGANFPAGSYVISYCYSYNGNQVTKITHNSLDLQDITENYIYELTVKLGEIFDKVKYLGSPVKTVSDLQLVSGFDRLDYQLRYVVSTNKEYRYDPVSTLTEDLENIIKPSDIDTLQSGRWLSSSGTSWFTGNTEPDPRLGKVGDFYYNNINSEIKTKTNNTTWTLLSSIRGSTWYNGPGVPTASLGLLGDYYAQGGNTGNVYRKTTNTTWTLSLNIKGVKGDTGDIGPVGFFNSDSNSQFTTTSLAANSTAVFTVPVGTVVIFNSITTSVACRVRVYQNLTSAQADLTRGINIKGQKAAGLVLDIVTGSGVYSDASVVTNQLSWLFSGTPTLVNADIPKTNNAYISITNMTNIATAITVAFNLYVLRQ